MNLVENAIREDGINHNCLSCDTVLIEKHGINTNF